MVKRILILLSIVITGVKINAQQSTPSSDNFIPVLQNKDVFFNPKMINPAYLTDSCKLHIDLVIYNQWISAVNNPRKGYLISGETNLGSTNNSLGLNMEYQNKGLFEHRFFVAGYKYKWSLTNHSNIDFGMNLGVWQSKLNKSNLILQQSDPMSIALSKWTTHPYFRVGVAGNYKYHTLGISYDFTPIKIKSVNTESYLKDKGLIINYRASFKMMQKFSLIPELYGCFSELDNYGIITVRMKYDNLITIGFLYNSRKSTGFQISGIVLKKIKIGYFFEMDNSDNNTTIAALHGFNLGIML